MKNKRNVLIAFILICCLCLSIGYATLTDTLYINGKVSVDAVNPDVSEPTTPVEKAFEDDLGWTKVYVSEKHTDNDGQSDVAWVVTGGTSADDTTAISDTAPTSNTYDYVDNVWFNVSGFSKSGDYVVLTYTIGNRHPDLNALVSKPTVVMADSDKSADDDKYFEVTTNWDENTSATVVGKNTNNVTVEVIVKMIKTPTTDRDASFTLTFGATAQEATP